MEKTCQALRHVDWTVLCDAVCNNSFGHLSSVSGVSYDIHVSSRGTFLPYQLQAAKLLLKAPAWY